MADNLPAKSHLEVAVSLSLLPVLMPLLARLRHLFDPDAEPATVDAHLAQHDLSAQCTAIPASGSPVRSTGSRSRFGCCSRIRPKG